MATLHVRNVPDDLYERLRAQAEAEGRSIGAEAVQLLELQLAGGGSRRGLLRRRGAAPVPGGHMSPAARAVVASAQEEARGLGHAYVGTEHLLLGVLAQRSLPGLTLEGARRGAEALVGRGEGAPTHGYVPFTARAKKVLELALREAHLGAIEPEHIALGMLREGEGAGFQLLSASAPDIRSARAALHEALEAAPPVPPFRVLELDGAATDWESSLNEAAAAGYELVSVVDRRAVLRLTV
jgi:antitoxin FitA-like protein/ClpA/ClpB-like protein